jgi:hypothetical protein
VAVHKQRMNIKLCKPIYLGQTILDQSKHLMYDFHYNFILKKVERENVDLLFTDTDSLCYNIRKQDIFKIIKDNEELFDLSNYPKDSEMYNKTNNKVIGKFKNESIKQITEFVGLRAKLYTYTVEEDEHNHNRCKGIKKSVAETIDISEYKNTLETRDNKQITQNGFRCHAHQIFTESMTKTALSACDDKVYIDSLNVKTYNFGHWRIRK